MKKLILFVVILAAIIAALYYGRQLITGKVGSGKVYSIGILVRGKSYQPGVDGFKAKMVELGYVEGKNVTYDVRFVDKKEDIPGAIKEFINKKVDLIHTYSTPVTIEAYRQTKTIPIVFGSMGDPLGSGVIQSLQAPGTNVTGISSLSVDLAAKRVELLKELFPSIKQVAMALTTGDLTGEGSLRVATDAGAKLGIKVIPYRIQAPMTAKDIAATIYKKDVDGIALSSDSATWAQLSAFVGEAEKEKLPFSVFDKDMVVDGGLVGYGPDYYVVGGQAAVLVHKILKGAQPGELPVESPDKFILAVNLKTAGKNGFVIPDSFLSKADLIVR